MDDLVHRRAKAGQALGGCHLQRGEAVRDVGACLERGVVHLQEQLALREHSYAPDEFEADFRAEESRQRRHQLGAAVVFAA